MPRSPIAVARRHRALFFGILVGLTLPMFAIDALGADASPGGVTVAAAAGPATTAAPATTPATTASTTTTSSVPIMATPVTLLVSAEVETTTTAPPTTARPTTTTTTRPPTTTPPTTKAPSGHSQTGTATWYRGGTASGCAHLTLPKGTVVTVTALGSGRSVTCTVDDRGPFGGHIIDLSPSGFAALAPLDAGVVSVRITW